MITAPIYWQRITLDTNDYDQAINSEGRCRCAHYNPFFVSIALVNGAAILLACHQAYRARSAETELNESKFIGMAMVCIGQSFFFGIPMLIINRNDASAFLYVFSSVIFVICMSILLFSFLPLILKQYRTDHQGTSSTSTASRMTQYSGMSSRLKRLRDEQRIFLRSGAQSLASSKMFRENSSSFFGVTHSDCTNEDSRIPLTTDEENKNTESRIENNKSQKRVQFQTDLDKIDDEIEGNLNIESNVKKEPAMD